jgi:hypothetical protein
MPVCDVVTALLSVAVARVGSSRFSSVHLRRYGCRREYPEDRVLEVDNMEIRRQGHSKEQAKTKYEWTFQTLNPDSNNLNLLPTMSTTVFPVSLYEGVFPKLVAILKLTQDPYSTPSKTKNLQAVVLPTVPRLSLPTPVFPFDAGTRCNARFLRITLPRPLVAPSIPLYPDQQAKHFEIFTRLRSR